MQALIINDKSFTSEELSVFTKEDLLIPLLKRNILSQIDLMIEIVESKINRNFEYHSESIATQQMEGRNKALSDLSTLLSAQRKLIEEQ